MAMGPGHSGAGVCAGHSGRGQRAEAWGHGRPNFSRRHHGEPSSHRRAPVRDGSPHTVRRSAETRVRSCRWSRTRLRGGIISQRPQVHLRPRWSAFEGQGRTSTKARFRPTPLLSSKPNKAQCFSSALQSHVTFMSVTLRVSAASRDPGGPGRFQPRLGLPPSRGLVAAGCHSEPAWGVHGEQAPTRSRRGEHGTFK